MLEALAAASVGTLEDDRWRAEEAVHVHLDLGASPVAALLELFWSNVTCAARARPSRPDVR